MHVSLKFDMYKTYLWHDLVRVHDPFTWSLSCPLDEKLILPKLPARDESGKMVIPHYVSGLIQQSLVSVCLSLSLNVYLNIHMPNDIHEDFNKYAWSVVHYNCWFDFHGKDDKTNIITYPMFLTVPSQIKGSLLRHSYDTLPQQWVTLSTNYDDPNVY